MDAYPIANRVAALVRRDEFVNCTRIINSVLEEGVCRVPFWYTRTGLIIKWSVFLALTTLFGLYLILGYTHAKRRIRKGIPPLAYHRWLVSRRELATVDPRFAYAAQSSGYHAHRTAGAPSAVDYYGMHVVPPPVYDPNAPRPPTYGDLGTKTDPVSAAQPTFRPADQQTEAYAPPSGPPPPLAHQTDSLRPLRTGDTNLFRN